MPTYDYRCKFCGHKFEYFQSIVSQPLKTCPKCQRNSLERLISGGAGLIFKGSGFYETDYKRNSNYIGKEKLKGEKSSEPAEIHKE
jgi:putative FmdB family regulatory protein